MTERFRIVRRSIGRLMLGAVVAQALIAGGVLVARSGGALLRAWQGREETAPQRLLRHYPAEYLRAIAEIRSHVSEEDFYLLVDAEPEERGASYLVNFFLAPRRGVLIGRTRIERGELIGRRLAQRRLADWVVWVPEVPRPPELLDRESAAARLREMP